VAVGRQGSKQDFGAGLNSRVKGERIHSFGFDTARVQHQNAQEKKPAYEQLFLANDKDKTVIKHAVPFEAGHPQKPYYPLKV
jgi:hypothetical protein